MNKIYTSPTGLPTNPGTRLLPMDLQTALYHPETLVDSGGTVAMLGGKYKGCFVSYLKKATLLSEKGHWAVIDGNYRLTLARDLAPGYGNLLFNEPSSLPYVAYVMIDGEGIELVSKDDNGYIINNRSGWPGVPHKKGAIVIVRMKAFDTKDSVSSVYRDFETDHTQPERTISTPGSNSDDPNYRMASVNFAAPASKLINLVVHDGGDVGFWENAVDSEIYGCIIYNGGHTAPDSGHGSGIYTQNSEGTKTISDNVIFENYNGLALQLYGSSAAVLRGYRLDGNVGINDNGWLVGGNAPADDIEFTNHFTYKTGLAFGYGNPYNGTAKVENSHFWHGQPNVKYFKKFIFKGNKVYNEWPTGHLFSITVKDNLDSLKNWEIDNNEYIYAQEGPGYLRPFYIQIEGQDGVNYSWEEWQALGFDLNSTFTFKDELKGEKANPSGQDIYYRPNKYQPGRCNIVCYNYDAKPSFKIAMSQVKGLKLNQKFEIRNAFNYKAPIIYSGTFKSQTISIPFTKLKIAQPFGITTKVNEEISPHFATLVIIPK